MVGLPAAGKTTRAAELAAARKALRLTPDHWMVPLFGDSMADGKRFVLERPAHLRLVRVGSRTLALLHRQLTNAAKLQRSKPAGGIPRLM